MTDGPFLRAGIALVGDLEQALLAGAVEIMSEADILVPKDTLTLRESARIFPVENNGTVVSVEFGYGYGGARNPKTGNPVDEYTVPVHEILEAHHEPPTQAKFLEQPLFAYASRMGQEISAEIRISSAQSLGRAHTEFPLFGGGYAVRGNLGRFTR